MHSNCESKMNGKSIFGAMLLGIVVVVSALAQPDTVWTRVYGGSGNESIHSIAATADGGVGILGTFTVSADSSYRAVLKLSIDGDSLWTCTVQGWPVSILALGNDLLIADIVDVEPGILRLQWINPRGQIARIHSYAPIGKAPIYLQLHSCIDGGVAISAGHESGNTTKSFIFKVDANGDSLWYREYEGEYEYNCSFIATGNQFFMMGRVGLGEQSVVRVTRLSEYGENIWENSYTGSRHFAYPYAMWPQTNGVGALMYMDSLCFYRIDSIGDLRPVSRNLEVLTSGYLRTPTCLSNNQYLFEHSNPDLRLLDLSESGDFLWNLTFGAGGIEHSEAIVQTSDGGIVDALISNSFSRGDAHNFDMWIVKFAPSADVIEPETTLPRSVSLLSSYPNPFNSRAVIEYHLDAPGFVRLGLFDTNWRMVEQLSEGMKANGMHRLMLDGSGLPTGGYQLRLITPSETRTSRVTLSK